MRFPSTILWLTVLTISAGCTPEETAPAGAGPIPIENFRAESEAANCDYSVRCTLMPDVATCRQLDGASYDVLQLVADVALGTVSYDPGAARAWVEAVRNQPCALHDATAKRGIDDLWKAVFIGKAAKDGSCFVDEECQSGLLCDVSACMGNSSCCAGKCAAAPQPIAIGQPCGMMMDPRPCVDGAFCGPTMADPMVQECQAQLDNAEPCTSVDQCRDGAYCPSGGNGECYKLSTTGQSCNPTLAYSCASFADLCDPMSKTCVALPRDGKPCGSNGAGCALYTYCNNGTCTTRPKDGEMCAQDGPKCLGDYHCPNGTCERQMVQVCTGG